MVEAMVTQKAGQVEKGPDLGSEERDPAVVEAVVPQQEKHLTARLTSDHCQEEADP